MSVAALDYWKAVYLVYQTADSWAQLMVDMWVVNSAERLEVQKAEPLADSMVAMRVGERVWLMAA